MFEKEDTWTNGGRIETSLTLGGYYMWEKYIEQVDGWKKTWILQEDR